MKCRHCGSALELPFLDLGAAPPSNAYLSTERMAAPETWYPLRVLVCESCWLVQTEDYAGREALFDQDYAYFSSFSSSWLAHARTYVETMTQRFSLGNNSHIVEVAANDGYLLQYAKQAGIPCYGIEPTASTARAARDKGIEIIEEFFGTGLAARLASSGRRADLVAANNVLAHVPDINDFVAGFRELLQPDGVATFEFPHLLRLVQENQFDTIYHEHYSYLSLTAVVRIFAANGLTVFDAEELPTHGGSLRVFAHRSGSRKHPGKQAVEALLQREQDAGMTTTAFYSGFQAHAETVKNDLLAFLIEARRQGKKVAAYGAAAKGNTLLNFAGVRPDLLAWVADASPHKQGRFMPGSRIPIVAPSRIATEKPDYLVILPWNLRREISGEQALISNWGGHFVIAVPTLQVL